MPLDAAYRERDSVSVHVLPLARLYREATLQARTRRRSGTVSQGFSQRPRLRLLHEAPVRAARLETAGSRAAAYTLLE